MAEVDWLDTTPAVRIQSSTKVPNEKKRFAVMQKKYAGNDRTWATDGRYVAFRRKIANPEALQRHNEFVDRGHYQHVETQDDVEIYKLTPQSPFYRRELDMRELSLPALQRAASILACKQDWKTYTDAIEEVAGRIKAAYDSGTAKAVFADTLAYIHVLISLRGGPSENAIREQIAAVQASRKRGSRLIALPSRRRV